MCYNVIMMWNNKTKIAQRKRRAKRKKPCPICQIPIDPRSTGCKLHCQKQVPSGEGHHWWKGGRTSNHEGYIMIKSREHPRAPRNHGYVFEHVLVWEETHKKYLPDRWVIHHLNGIKHDNRPSNLLALPRRKHYLILQAKAKRIQELEAIINNQGHLL